MLVSLSPAPTFVANVSLYAPPTSNFPITVDAAAARGAFLFVASGPTLRIYSLADPMHPTVTASFDAPAPIRTVTSVPNGFLAFGDALMVGIANPAQPLWNVKSDATLPFAHKAVTSGTQVAVAGAGHIAGRSQIARIDASNPADPVVVLSVDDLPVQFVDFAWDGSSRYVVFGQGTTSPNVNTSPMLFAREEGGNLRDSSTSRVWPMYDTGHGSNVHAWNDHLYRTEIGVKAYRLP
jgi:hypothetical protein